MTMEYRPLGQTGVRLSAVSFGAGPVPALMTGPDADRQLETVHAALQAGINGFDTAAGYGQGRSEAGLGAALAGLGASRDVHLATKVRLQPADLDDIAGGVRRSVERSLQRLRVDRVTLLQLHNAIAFDRGAWPDAVTPDDVLRPGGVADTLARLRQEGLIAHFGLTATGDSAALRQVIRTGVFQTAQVPFSLVDRAAARTAGGGEDAEYGLPASPGCDRSGSAMQDAPADKEGGGSGGDSASANTRDNTVPSAHDADPGGGVGGSRRSGGGATEGGSKVDSSGRSDGRATEGGSKVGSSRRSGVEMARNGAVPEASPGLHPEPGSLLAECMAQGMGVLAIRVFAGGALAGQPPSAHTLQTQYFPLDLYHRDRRRGEHVRRILDPGTDLREIALRFVLSHPAVTSAIIGFGAPGHVTAAAAFQAAGPLPPAMLRTLAGL